MTTLFGDQPVTLLERHHDALAFSHRSDRRVRRQRQHYRCSLHGWRHRLWVHGGVAQGPCRGGILGNRGGIRGSRYAYRLALGILLSSSDLTATGFPAVPSTSLAEVRLYTGRSCEDPGSIT